MTLSVLIQVLLVVLILAGIAVAVRLWGLLGSVRTTLANLETTRLEATETLKRVDSTLATAEQMIREEVAPTLQAARATINNVEVTTRVLAETSVALRRLTGKAESITDTSRMISAGGALLQLVTHRNAKPANAGKTGGGSLLSSVALGIGTRFAQLLTRRRSSAKPALPPSEPEVEAPPTPKRKQKTLRR